MRCIIITDVDLLGQIDEYNVAPTESDAISMVSKLKEKGHSNAFYAPHPEIAIKYITVDLVNKTITSDESKRDHDKNLSDWKSQMSDTDYTVTSPADIARFMEGWYDANPEALARKPQSYRDSMAARKVLRSQKP